MRRAELSAQSLAHGARLSRWRWHARITAIHGMKLQPGIEEQRGPSRYLWQRKKTHALPDSPIDSSCFARAVLALWPWAGTHYPGRLEALDQLFKWRVARTTIRGWRKGRRRPPQWAIDALSEELQKRITECESALAELDKEKGRRL